MINNNMEFTKEQVNQSEALKEEDNAHLVKCITGSVTCVRQIVSLKRKVSYTYTMHDTRQKICE